MVEKPVQAEGDSNRAIFEVFEDDEVYYKLLEDDRI